MGYWFDSKKNTKEKCTQPYTPHWNLDNIKYARVEENPKWKAELLNNSEVLSKLYSYLISMLVYCRKKKSKTMRVSEEDLLFLCEIASKEIEIDWSKVER